jgi:hypothetical protein
VRSHRTLVAVATALLATPVLMAGTAQAAPPSDGSAIRTETGTGISLPYGKGLVGQRKPTQKELALQRAEAAARKITDYATAKGALGIYRDPRTSEMVIRIPASGPASKLTTWDLAAAGITARVQASVHTQAQIDAVAEVVKKRDWHPTAARYSYGFQYDAQRDATVVGTDAPADVMAPLLAQLSTAIIYEKAPTGRNSRNADPPPHFGGAAITDGDVACTSGFTVKNSADARFMVTAAHCFDSNTEVHSFNGSSFGTVVTRRPLPTFDMELLGGSSYNPLVYIGGANGGASFVTGAEDPVLDVAGYCRSGAFSFEQCNLTFNSLNGGTLCDTEGCTPGLATYTGGAAGVDGDSGAPIYSPFFSGVSIAGMYIGAVGNTGYVERWNTISAHFGVSIVTAITTVPNVVSFMEDYAREEIEEAGLVVANVWYVDDCIAPGEVKIQNPSGGAQTLPGTSVDLTVATCSGIPL